VSSIFFQASPTSSLSLHSPDLHFDQMEPPTQQIIELSLTAPSACGHQFWEDNMPALVPVHEQLQVGPNFFQAPAHPSHSTPLTCVAIRQQSHPSSKQSNFCSLHPPCGHCFWEDAMPVLMPVCEQLQMGPNFFHAPAPPSHSTCLTCVSTRQSHAPSKSLNFHSLHPPNMDASSGKMPCLFSCLFVSNCKQDQTSSKPSSSLSLQLHDLSFDQTEPRTQQQLI
jgi:hypothetical protein